MTEDEAKIKWCPMIRTGLTAGMAVNAHVTDDKGKDGDIYNETRCRASECMMWRWFSLPAAVVTIPQKNPSGYCGLTQ